MRFFLARYALKVPLYVLFNNLVVFNKIDKVVVIIIKIGNVSDGR